MTRDEIYDFLISAGLLLAIMVAMSLVAVDAMAHPQGDRHCHVQAEAGCHDFSPTICATATRRAARSPSRPTVRLTSA
jgi:hypothetical protein